MYVIKSRGPLRAFERVYKITWKVGEIRDIDKREKEKINLLMYVYYKRLSFITVLRCVISLVWNFFG